MCQLIRYVGGKRVYAKLDFNSRLPANFNIAAAPCKLVLKLPTELEPSTSEVVFVIQSSLEQRVSLKAFFSAARDLRNDDHFFVFVDESHAASFLLDYG